MPRRKPADPWLLPLDGARPSHPPLEGTGAHTAALPEGLRAQRSPLAEVARSPTGSHDELRAVIRALVVQALEQDRSAQTWRGSTSHFSQASQALAVKLLCEAQAAMPADNLVSDASTEHARIAVEEMMRMADGRDRIAEQALDGVDIQAQYRSADEIYAKALAMLDAIQQLHRILPKHLSALQLAARTRRAELAAMVDGKPVTTAPQGPSRGSDSFYIPTGHAAEAVNPAPLLHVRYAGQVGRAETSAADAEARAERTAAQIKLLSAQQRLALAFSCARIFGLPGAPLRYDFVLHQSEFHGAVAGSRALSVGGRISFAEHIAALAAFHCHAAAVMRRLHDLMPSSQRNSPPALPHQTAATPAPSTSHRPVTPPRRAASPRTALPSQIALQPSPPLVEATLGLVLHSPNPMSHRSALGLGSPADRHRGGDSVRARGWVRSRLAARARAVSMTCSIPVAENLRHVFSRPCH
jgi:tellurite resistance protein